MALWDDLKAYYQCSSTSDSWGGFDATFNSVSVGSGTGKFGDSWEFASAAAYVSLGTTIPLTSGGWTVMAWGYTLRPDSAYRTLFYNGIAGVNGSMHFITQPATAVAGTWSNNTFFGSGTALAAASYTGWHHYCATFNGTNVTLYVDGVAIGTTTPTWPGGHQVAQIGGDTYGEGFAERLDDVAVWGRQLSSEEVATIYNAGNSGNPLESLIGLEAGLRSYYEAANNRDSWNAMDLTKGSGVYNISYNDQFSEYYDKWHFDFGTNNSNSYLQANPVIPVSSANNFTFACWARGLQSDGSERHLFKMSNGEIPFYIDPSTNQLGVYDGAFYSATASFAASDFTDWFHVAVTYASGGVSTFYLNGAQTGSTVNKNLDFTALEFIGGSNSAARQFASSLDDIVIWERKLDEDEIKKIYDVSKGGASPFRKLIPARQINDDNKQMGWLDTPMTNNYNKLNYHMNTVISSSASSSYSENFESTATGSLPSGWTTFGNVNWQVTGSDAHGGTKSAGSNPALNDNQSTSLAYTASIGSAQTLTFWWKVSSENNYDWLTFYIDGVQKDRISGSPAWAEKSYSLPSGSSILKWTYSKDGSSTSGQDAAWIDDISIGDPGGITTLDGSGNGNTATLTGITSADTGSYITMYSGSDGGGAATAFTASIPFNGSSSKMDTGVTAADIGANSNNERTIMLWASSSAWVNYKPFFSMGTNSTRQDFTLVQRTDGDIQLNLWGDDLTFTPPSTSGWHHYACTYDNGSNVVYVYIDGQLAGSKVLGGALNTSTSNNLLIGAGAHYFAGQYFSGSIQEFSAWSTELSSQQIYDIYTHQAQSLLGYLTTGSQKLVTEVATVVHDVSNYATVGTLQATALHTAIDSSKVATLHGTAMMSRPDPSGSVLNITGTVGIPATFDASPLGYSTSSVSFQWNWVSVPSGSALSGSSFPFPNAKANTYFNMGSNRALYHFDDNADDSSGDGNNGTLVGSPSYDVGKVGPSPRAISFGGSGEYVNVADDPSLNGVEGTISLWFKTGNGDKISLISKNDASSSRNGWNLGIHDNQPFIQIKDGSSTTNISPATTAVNDSKWHHLAASFVAGGPSKLYLDGALVGSDDNTVSFSVSSQPLRMGVNVDSYWNDYVGFLDEVALFDQVLSSADISNIYFMQSGSCASGSIGLGETFTFTPDVSGTYQVNLNITDGYSAYDVSGYSYAYISASSPTNQSGTIEGTVWEVSSDPIDLPSIAISGTTTFIHTASCFQASASFVSTGSSTYQWEWVSIPSGSLITSGSRTGFSGSSGPYSEVPTGSQACFLPDIAGSYIVKGSFYTDTGSAAGSFAFNYATGTAMDHTEIEGAVWEVAAETAGQARAEGTVWEISSDPIDLPSIAISGTTTIVHTASCFQASASFISTGSSTYQWEWVSIPSGSLITSGLRTGFSGSSGPYSEVPTGSQACFLPDIIGNYVVKSSFYTDTGSAAGSFAFNYATGTALDPTEIEGAVWEVAAETAGQTRIEGSVWEIAAQEQGAARIESSLWEISADPVDRPTITVPDITGNTLTSSCFIATASYSTSGSTKYEWEWVSIPSGSLITSGSRTGFSGSSGAYSEVPTGTMACYYPDLTGSYIVKATFYNDTGSAAGSFVFTFATGTESDSVFPTPASTPTDSLVERESSGYVFNTYAIRNLSVQRARFTDEVPFKLGTKGPQSLRHATNAEFTGSS